MEIIWASIVSALASLGGVSLGALSTRSQARFHSQQAARDEQTATADAIADQFIRALTALRRLPVPYFEELAEEHYLPQQWYETFEPAVLQALGKLQDADVRKALRTIVASIGDSQTRDKEASSTYHYIEGQILLGVDIIQSYGRGEPLNEDSVKKLHDLQARMRDRPS